MNISEVIHDLADLLGNDVEEKRNVDRSLGFSEEALSTLYSICSGVATTAKELSRVQ